MNNQIPKHVAIIMDGNGRWAQLRGLGRIEGHKEAKRAVHEVTEEAVRLKIKYLTLFCFSTENWHRPKSEVDMLMHLIASGLQEKHEELSEKNIKLNVIGRLKELSQSMIDELNFVTNKTAGNDGLILTLAVNYGAREEICDAVVDIATKVKKSVIDLKSVDQALIENHLYTQNLPEVDLLIRTSGEYRISNFLLWQIAYAEMYFSDLLWPDFRKEDLQAALLSFRKRERRFGKVSEQVRG